MTHADKVIGYYFLTTTGEFWGAFCLRTFFFILTTTDDLSLTENCWLPLKTSGYHWKISDYDWRPLTTWKLLTSTDATSGYYWLLLTMFWPLEISGFYWKLLTTTGDFWLLTKADYDWRLFATTSFWLLLTWWHLTTDAIFWLLLTDDFLTAYKFWLLTNSAAYCWRICLLTNSDCWRLRPTNGFWILLRCVTTDNLYF